jgi:hypothetical protein
MASGRPQAKITNDRNGRPTNYLSLAGEFFVLGELARRRLDGTMTLGHAKEIDILVLNRVTARTFKVEVKTSQRPINRSTIFGPCHTWLMDERHGHLADPELVYAFVLLDRTEPRARMFLVPAADVAAYVAWEHKHWRRHSVRQTGKTTRMRVFRIPTGDDRCKTPPSWRDGRWRDWEDNWAIFTEPRSARARGGPGSR